MQKRRLPHLFISIALAAGLTAWLGYASLATPAGVTSSSAQASGGGQEVAFATVRVDLADENGVRFVLSTPKAATGGGLATVPGLEHRIQRPGAPALPYYTTYIAVPPGAHVTVALEELGTRRSQVGAIAPAAQIAPEPASERPFPGEAMTSEKTRLSPPRQIAEPDPRLYAADRMYPESPFSLSDPMYWRDLRLVELRLYPVRYNPVHGVLVQVEQMEVEIRFVGEQQAGTRSAPSRDDAYLQGISDQVLNFEQATLWRALPDSLLATAGSGLPVGVDTYKITLDRDGIYEISGAELAAAGMPVGQVDPASLEMMYRGTPVAYQFIGDGDAVLEAAEKIRFYGWAFDGPRSEKQFVRDNVYWLWANGNPTRVLTEINQTGQGYGATTTFSSSVTREPENHFFATWTLWDGYPNEADAWFWDFVRKGPASLTKTYTVTLPYPAQSGPDATYIAEFSSRANLLPPSSPHVVRGYLNDDPSAGSVSWYGRANVNLSQSVPITRLVDGSNNVTLVYATNTIDQLYLNRITVDYLRQLIASNDQLAFSDDTAGGKAFQVTGFSQGDASQVLAWDVSVITKPVQLEMNASHIGGGGGSFTYTLGITRAAAGSQFIVTTLANILTTSGISRYTPVSLDPPGDQAEWLTITHADFITEAQRLAGHRADPAYGGYLTHVVDIEDIVNQYGYGLPLPAAVHDYLAYGLGHWGKAPGYVVLMGDATQNPRQLDCGLGCFAWDKDEPTYVLTDLVFEDRFQGLIPSDHTFVLLSGIDLLPDMAIGRIPVQTLAEAEAVVDKIIAYELNQFTPEAWQQGIMFVADNTDSGGNFCSANLATGSLLPSSMQQTHLCLDPAGPISSAGILTPLMAAEINGPGISVLNYRGHGSVETWASELILTSRSTGFWGNAGKPVVILSADCLDGHFAWPGAQGLGESFLKLAGGGSVAHWSSSGLGFTSEHSVLHRGFYEAVFDRRLLAIGDAANFAKLRYFQGGYHESELYSFILEGDPAMRLFRPDVRLAKSALQPEAYPGQQVQFKLSLANDGIYPSLARVTDTLPSSLSFASATATQPMTYANIGGNIVIDLLSPVHWGEEVAITITADVSPSFLGVATNQAVASDSGYNLSGSTNLFASASITVTNELIGGLVAMNDSPSPLGVPTTFSASIASGVNVNYTWSFGDGFIGTGISVSHTYSSPGVFTAIVTASNFAYTSVASTTALIDGPIVGLKATNDSPTMAGSPTVLSTTLNSVTNATYVWGFGDGSYGSGAATSHTYAAPGLFTAVVTASNSASTAVATTTVSVEGQILGLAATNDSPTPLGLPTTLSATVASGTNISYSWSFGDGISGTGAIVSHAFSKLGRYTATVTATNSVSTMTKTTQVLVTYPYTLYLPIVSKP